MGKAKHVAIIGSGMAGLSAAALLSRDGAQVHIFEQNWMPGGCSSSYWRKGYWFETGATTLVGLDPGMPLHRLLEETGIELHANRLRTPMEVRIDGLVITRHEDLEAWIKEAVLHFGAAGQRAFWEECFQLSRQVWQISTRQLSFPPQDLRDILKLAHHFQFNQLAALPAAFSTVHDLLTKHHLLQNERFVRFIDEQLMITAQNTNREVNLLFGATALCYTNFGNYYMPGGLIKMTDVMLQYITKHGGSIQYRTTVQKIERAARGYTLHTSGGTETFDLVLSAIPLNNLSEMLHAGPEKTRISKHLFKSDQLSSALQMGIGFIPHRSYDAIHYQLHLPQQLPILGGKSIFLSLHPSSDTNRGPAGHCVASVSTHWLQPEKNKLENREALENQLLDFLEQQDLIKRNSIQYLHSSGPQSWEKWTGRKWGFVGGYPQTKAVKPWQMMGARVDKHGLYVCGDSTYPGQGIPGVVLSGLTAHHKIKNDGWL